MEDKLRLLAEKLVNDGLEEARIEKEKLLVAAKAQADSIVAEARVEAQALRAQTEKEMEQLRTAVHSELGQLTRRAKDSLSADLRNIFMAEVLQKPVQQSLDKHWPALLQVVVQQLYRDAQGRLHISLPAEKAAALEAVFANDLQALVQAGIDWQSDPRLRSGFRIGVEGQRYVVDFTEADFEKVLAPFYGAALKKLLANG